eukprot:975470-Rhodomonas_salina.1
MIPRSTETTLEQHSRGQYRASRRRMVAACSLAVPDIAYARRRRIHYTTNSNARNRISGGAAPQPRRRLHPPGSNVR